MKEKSRSQECKNIEDKVRIINCQDVGPGRSSFPVQDWVDNKRTLAWRLSWTSDSDPQNVGNHSSKRSANQSTQRKQPSGNYVNSQNRKMSLLNKVYLVP